MKTIALIGATGRTGQLFLEKALSAGYSVKALVRTPEKLKLRHPKLNLIEGSVLNEETVELVVQNADIVVSLFGHVKGSPDGLQTQGTKLIIKAMKAHGIRRIISLSGGGLPYPEKDQPKFADKLIRFIMEIAVPKILKDAKDHHLILEKSGLDWIIVRGPRLTDEPEKGNYRVGWVGVNASTKIGRADLADFILKQLEDKTYIRQMPFVSY